MTAQNIQIQNGAKIGLVSRIDFGSQGFRQALIDSSFTNIFSKLEGTHFNILAGGLISQKNIKEQMKEFIGSRVEAEKEKIKKKKTSKKKKDRPESLIGKRLKRRRSELQEEFLRGIAKQLSKIFPALKGPDPENPEKEKNIDLFIVTSPAFDGEIGETVAQFLSELRPDIRVWNSGGDRFLIKYVNKLLWVLTPKKAVWMRGDYYSTSAERVLKDKIKQTGQGSPDLYVVGCFGSSLNKPKGELKYRYVTVPACHRLDDTRVNENQIGVSILEFPSDGSEFLYRTYSLKDLVSQELNFVVPPEGASPVQKKIIANIKEKGCATSGSLKYDLGITLEEILKALKGLEGKKTFRRNGENWPGIYFQEKSKKWYFDLEYLQHRLKYALSGGSYNEDILASFACVHAGSVETDYQFFTDELPKLILKSGATVLIDGGDTKEGMKHSLDKKGEIIAGMNLTKQEKFAANLVGTVILRVFKARFTALCVKIEPEKLTPDKVKELFFASMLLFIYILGNHDLWETEDGHEPLELFHEILIKFVTNNIWQELLSRKISAISYYDLMRLVENKIQRKEFFELPSGLKVSVQHPHMSRAKTTSIRPQEMMEFGKRFGCQITIGANFHVSESVNEWDMDLGQCHSQEVGTIKHGSSFERHKMKMVDQGIGCLRILSRNKRIFMTESVFYGASKPKPPIDNADVLDAYLTKELKIEPLHRI